MPKRSLTQHSLRLKAYNLLAERFKAVEMLESIDSEDYEFIKNELIDVLEMVAEHLQEKAAKKLDRTLMALKLLRAELNNVKTETISIPCVD